MQQQQRGVASDRAVHLLERVATPFPLPPLNVFCKSGYELGLIDLKWDSPSNLVANAPFTILGVNIYRSIDSEFGPFTRINEFPIGANFYRDRTENVLVEENVSGSFLLRDTVEEPANPGQYVFKTSNAIVVPESQGVPTNNPKDVVVWVNGLEVPVLNVRGASGEVTIDPYRRVNYVTQSLEGTLPILETDTVICAYRYNRNLIGSQHRIFYRITTVGYDSCGGNSGNLVETPIDVASPTQLQEIEKLDYIWREAIRRNRWILDQGGERVKVFIRKTAGVPCPCIPDSHHNQPISDCLLCIGTGFIGGYEGPFNLTIAPDDGERTFNRTPIGATVSHTYEVWTGPSPMLSQRDMVIRQNGDRYSIGAVRMPSNRGNILQQHFQINLIDEKDIRYRVLVDGVALPPLTLASLPSPDGYAPAEITEKPNIPDEREERGRTKAWENINFLAHETSFHFHAVQPHFAESAKSRSKCDKIRPFHSQREKAPNSHIEGYCRKNGYSLFLGSCVQVPPCREGSRSYEMVDGCEKTYPH